MKSIKLKNMICNNLELMNIQDERFLYFDINLADFFVEWLEKEVQNIVNENYKDSLKNTYIMHTLYPGEYDIYLRNTGIKTESASTIIDNTRNPLEVTWWVSESISKAAGLKLRHAIPFLESIIIMFVFNNYCKSMGKFHWDTLALILEKNIILEYKTILISKEPIIIQIMNTFLVIDKNNYVEFDKIEQAIVFWLHLLSTKNKDKSEKIFYDNLKSHDIEPLLDIYEYIKKDYRVNKNKDTNNVHVNNLEHSVFFVDI
jgi:predicted nucleic acid-binding protein